MSGRTLSLGGAKERPLVDINGKAYRIKAVTRSVQIEMDSLDRELRELMKNEDAQTDDLVDLYGRGMDAMAAPEGHRTPVSKVVKQLWEADELSMNDLREFSDSLQELATERPT